MSASGEKACPEPGDAPGSDEGDRLGGATLPDAVLDVRTRFRARCLRIARERGDGSEALVARWFASGADAADGAPGSSTVAHVAAGERRPARLLVVPGLFGETVSALVAPLMCAREGLRAEGRDIDVVWLNGRAGCTRNAIRLRTVVLEKVAADGAPLDLVGYSKGCADALHMLGDWPDTHAALRSLVSLGGIVSGTPLAAATPRFVSRALSSFPLPGKDRGDGRAIHDLTPAWRRRWLEDHPLPEDLRRASIVGVPSAERISRVLKPAWHVLSALDPRNDAQVAMDAAMLPRGELLATVDADHWALALPIAERSALLGRLFVTRNDFPRTVMLEALMDHLAEPRPSSTVTSS